MAQSVASLFYSGFYSGESHHDYIFFCNRTSVAAAIAGCDSHAGMPCKSHGRTYSGLSERMGAARRCRVALAVLQRYSGAGLIPWAFQYFDVPYAGAQSPGYGKPKLHV
jgi:hypothetical protein